MCLQDPVLSSYLDFSQRWTIACEAEIYPFLLKVAFGQSVFITGTDMELECLIRMSIWARFQETTSKQLGMGASACHPQFYKSGNREIPGACWPASQVKWGSARWKWEILSLRKSHFRLTSDLHIRVHICALIPTHKHVHSALFPSHGDTQTHQVHIKRIQKC